MRRVFPVLLILVLVPIGAAAGDADRVHLMLVNDDGIDAPGIAAMAAALAEDPGLRVTVVAPAEPQSGQGSALTIRGEVPVRPHPEIAGYVAWSVGATPATSARIGLATLLVDDPPALVVSGINRGENIGRSAWYSGTVGAARESVMIGVPAIAFSLQLDWDDPQPDWPGAAAWAKPVVDATLEQGLPAGVLLNVNIPADTGTIRGYRLARMGLTPPEVSRYELAWEDLEARWYRPRWRPPRDAERGSDIEAVATGWVAIVPLGLDQTDYRSLTELQDLRPTSPALPEPELENARPDAR